MAKFDLYQKKYIKISENKKIVERKKKRGLSEENCMVGIKKKMNVSLSLIECDEEGEKKRDEKITKQKI